MHFDLRHLRAIRAIDKCGGLSRAADMLNLTQSALSHQIKGLEDQAGVDLFVRRTKPLKLSAAGQRLLKLANRVLPEVEATEEEFRSLLSGKSGRLHIAIECHACFEWLFPVLESFRKAWPDVDVDIRPGLAFDACRLLRVRRWIWWSPPIQKSIPISNSHHCLTTNLCLLPPANMLWRKNLGLRRKTFAMRF